MSPSTSPALAAPPFATVAAQVLCAMFIMLVPALAVGHPFAFYDSDQYLSVGRAIWQAVFGAGAPGASYAAVALHPTANGAAPLDAAAQLAAAAPAEKYNLYWLSARSPFYSAPLYALVHLGSVWLVAALQALIVAGVLRTLVGLAGLARPGAVYIALVAFLTAASSAAFYSTFLMPDIFAAVAVLCAIILVFYGDRLGRWGGLFFCLLLAAATSMHTTILLLVVLACAVGGLVLWAFRQAPKQVAARLAGVVGGLALSMGLHVGLDKAVEMRFGEKPLNPPYVMARVLHDGPGRVYLAAACPQAGYELCAYRHKKLDDATQFIWEYDPDRSVFQFASAQGKRALIAEQWRFVLASIAYDPLAQARASLHNSLSQLVRFDLTPDLHAAYLAYVDGHYYPSSGMARVLPGLERCRAEAGRCRGEGGWRILHAIHVAAIVASLVGSAWLIRRNPQARFRPATGAIQGLSDDQRLLGLTIVIGVIILGNAVMCGVLSGPSDRYAARVIWLIPLAAALWAARAFDLRSATKEQA